MKRRKQVTTKSCRVDVESNFTFRISCSNQYSNVFFFLMYVEHIQAYNILGKGTILLFLNVCESVERGACMPINVN